MAHTHHYSLSRVPRTNQVAVMAVSLELGMYEYCIRRGRRVRSTDCGYYDGLLSFLFGHTFIWRRKAVNYGIAIRAFPSFLRPLNMTRRSVTPPTLPREGEKGPPKRLEFFRFAYFDFLKKRNFKKSNWFVYFSIFLGTTILCRQFYCLLGLYFSLFGSGHESYLEGGSYFGHQHRCIGLQYLFFLLM